MVCGPQGPLFELLPTVKRFVDLLVLSVSASCHVFGATVRLSSSQGMVKVLPNSFRAQVITLSAPPISEDEQFLHLPCLGPQDIMSSENIC